MGRVKTLIYGIVCYVIFFLTFLYAIGFIGDIVVPKTIDSGSSASGSAALWVNILLLALFAVQHSVMARPGFKKVWTKIVSPSAERSTYLLFTCVVLILLFWLWQPMSGVVWAFEEPRGPNHSLGPILDRVFDRFPGDFHDQPFQVVRPDPGCQAPERHLRATPEIQGGRVL